MSQRAVFIKVESYGLYVEDVLPFVPDKEDCVNLCISNGVDFEEDGNSVCGVVYEWFEIYKTGTESGESDTDIFLSNEELLEYYEKNSFAEHGYEIELVEHGNCLVDAEDVNNFYR